MVRASPGSLSHPGAPPTPTLGPAWPPRSLAPKLEPKRFYVTALILITAIDSPKSLPEENLAFNYRKLVSVIFHLCPGRAVCSGVCVCVYWCAVFGICCGVSECVCIGVLCLELVVVCVCVCIG